MNTPGPARPSESHDAITERAADFFERRRFGGWSDTDQAEFDAWLAESTFHRVAYLRLEGTAAYTEHLAAVHTFKPIPKSIPIAPDSNKKTVRRRFVLPLLAAASIVLAVALGIPLVNSLMQPPDRSFSTDLGDHTLLKFADGTEVDLNTDSAMHYRMTTVERTVWLERGEAWFRVSHNAANPFTVVVGKHRITDLGTEFLVRRGSDGMEVALLNGHAALSTEGAQTAMLKTGDDAVATPVSVSVTRKTPQELADELAWRQGLLVFRNTKLSDVVREFNRYNATKLVIADPSVAGETITANARTDDYESFLQFAEAELKLRADREGNNILISREQREQMKRAGHIKHSL
jgi:transmembrane sensor